MKMKEKMSYEDVDKIYKLFDNERDGFITLKSLRKVAKELGETIDDSELQEMIEIADTDGDGLVSFYEFYSILTKKTYS
jgi:Ca2+-binding EF-hand superfamily protein